MTSISYFESKNIFSKKSWALDHVPVFQIWPASYRFGRNLSFSWGVDRKVSDTPVEKFCILVGLVFFKNVLVPMWIFNLVVASQNTPFSAPQKWKMVFSCDEMENFLLQYRKTSQYAHVCTIWAYYHKLCRDSIHNMAVWPKCHETSNMIAHFVKDFLWCSQFSNFNIFPCNYDT
jgi:hypothetical protein